MPLGSDSTICKREFVEAMRARLNEEDPPLGSNVDRADVQANLGALGTAVFNIVTTHAESFSDPTTDPAFWPWLAAVDGWLQGLSQWQTTVAAAFAAWTPTTPPEVALKATLMAAPGPGVPPRLPRQRLNGKMR